MKGLLRWVGVLFSRLMRQIKQLFVGVLITMMVVLVFIFIYRDDDIDPVMPDFPPGLSQEEKVKIVQKKWQGMEKIALDSPEATNLVKRLVEEKGDILTPLQKSLLEEKLTAWFYQLKTGAYEDFMAFREPDHNDIPLSSLRYIAGKLHGGDTNALDNLPKSEWLKPVQQYWTTIRFDSLGIDSIHFNVRKWKQRTENMLKPFLFYPGPSRVSMGARLGKDNKPVIGYRVQPIDVQKKHWGIEWARFRAGYDISGYEGFVLAVELAMYWSPDEKRWLPGECRTSDVWPSKYLPKERGLPPRIFF